MSSWIFALSMVIAGGLGAYLGCLAGINYFIRRAKVSIGIEFESRSRSKNLVGLFADEPVLTIESTNETVRDPETNQVFVITHKITAEDPIDHSINRMFSRNFKGQL